MILNDAEIKYLCENKEMISPYLPEKIKTLDGKPITSKGQSSCGYDISLSPEWDFVIPLSDEACYDLSGEFHQGIFHQKLVSNVFILDPGNIVLARSVEYFKIPTDLMGSAIGKSTWARLGIFTNITPLEPGWEGHLTIEISNTAHYRVAVHAGWGIAQIYFLPCGLVSNPYSGKYQAQQGVTIAKL